MLANLKSLSDFNEGKKGGVEVQPGLNLGHKLLKFILLSGSIQRFALLIIVQTHVFITNGSDRYSM